MSEDVVVKKVSDGRYNVVVGSGGDTTEHGVTLPESYWQKLIGGEVTPEKLIEKSFYFLLEREPKESILGEFELSLISHYFPGYEKEIIKL